MSALRRSPVVQQHGEVRTRFERPWPTRVWVAVGSRKAW